MINPEGEDFDANEVFTLCNLKTKNYLHTHKIKIPDHNKLNEVSACPYNSNHILEYDLWKFIKTENNFYYIYHPFTQTFLNFHKNCIVCSPSKKEWKIVDFGRRRNGGFIKIIAIEEEEEVGEVCMMDNQALLPNHRKLSLCTSNHISHLW